MDAPILGPRPHQPPIANALTALVSFRCLCWVLFAAAALGTLFCLRQALPRLRQAADITTPDSVMVQTALWARHDGIIYHTATQPPDTPAVYGPLYYLALIGLSYLTGPALAPLLLAGRLFTLVCFAALAVLLWFWARRLGLPRGLALLAPGFLGSQIAFVHWDITTRPDVCALLAGAAAVYAASFAVPLQPPQSAPRGRWGPGRGGWGVGSCAGEPLTPAIVAGLLAASGLLLKQSALAAPAVIALWFGIRQHWRALAAFAAAGIALVAAVLGALLLHGERLGNLALLQHPYHSWSTALGIALRQLAGFGPDALLLALALTGIAVGWRALRWNAEPPGRHPAGWGLGTEMRAGGLMQAATKEAWALSIGYFFLSWTWGLLTLGLNSGGGGNYLLAGWTMTALLAAAGAATLRPVWAATPATARAVMILWAAGVAAAGLVTWHHRAGLKPANLASLAAVVAHRRVLTDVPYIGVHSQQPEYLDPYLLRTLELTGRWHSGGLVAQIEQHRFALILLDMAHGQANIRYRGLTRYDRRTVAAMRQAYRSYCVRKTVAVFLPANDPPSPVLATALRRAGCHPALAPVGFTPAAP